MDCLFGIVGDGFTLVAADTSACQSIIRMKQGEDKILEASNGKMLLVSALWLLPSCVWWLKDVWN
jgi:20S proteasome subunit beta 4